MDRDRFDALARGAAALASRRDTFGFVLAAMPTALGFGRADAAPHKKRKKNKGRKPPPLNSFGCVDVGKRCNGNDELCCSGICRGNAPKKGAPDESRCIAHDEFGCEKGEDDCAGVKVACGPPGRKGFCARTTGKAGFCGAGGDCAVCKKDTDCVASHGTGAACIICAQCPQTGNTVCMPTGFLG